jgi:hypothetical protein
MRTPTEINEAQKVARLKRKMLIFRHYSSEIPFCACCGEEEIKFLSIDHINGGGTKHRQELQKAPGKPAGGSVIYGWIVKNNFPEGFQILCHNCNQAKGFYGMCPHKEKLEI